MSVPTFIFPAILVNENDDASVSAYLDASREESGCSLMQAIRILVSNLNTIRTKQRRKLMLRLWRDPVTHLTILRTIIASELFTDPTLVDVIFEDGCGQPMGRLVDIPPEVVETFRVGVEWVLSQPAVAPLVARVDPTSMPPII